MIGIGTGRFADFDDLFEPVPTSRRAHIALERTLAAMSVFVLLAILGLGLAIVASMSAGKAVDDAGAEQVRAEAALVEINRTTWSAARR